MLVQQSKFRHYYTMIRMLEENNFFIALSKPSGVSVHNQSPSLAEWLTAQKYPLHFVNRLDEQTSGITIVAKTAEVHHKLQLALKTGQKHYRALLRGAWKEKTQQVTWSESLSDKAEGRKNPQGLKADQKPCVTHVNLVRSNSYFSEVLCQIETGRQHQIRKHACLHKQPLVGDKRYNEAKYNDLMLKKYNTQRLLLHCELIEFELELGFEKKLYKIADNILDLSSYF